MNQVCRISHSVGVVGSPDAPGDVPRHPACLPPPLLLVLEEEVRRLLSKCLPTLIVNCRQFLVVFKGNKSFCRNSFFYLVNPTSSLKIEERTKQTQNTQTKILYETHFPCNWIFCSHILFTSLNWTSRFSGPFLFFFISVASLKLIHYSVLALLKLWPYWIIYQNHLIVLWVLKINTKINCLSVCEYFQSSVLSCIKLIFVTTMKVNKKPGQWTNTFVTFYSFIHTNLC